MTAAYWTIPFSIPEDAVSYKLGSREFKLPDDVADMVKLGRHEFIRHLNEPRHCQVDPARPTNPQNHLGAFRAGLGLVDMIQVRLAEGEILGNRRESFGLMVIAVACYHAWADYFHKSGYTSETMQLGEKRAKFEKITSGTLLGSVTTLIDRTVQEPAAKDLPPRTVPFILNPDEVPKAAAIKHELQQMAVFPHGPWFLQPTRKRGRITGTQLPSKTVS